MSAVEAAGLGAIADEVTVHFPWGPLLDAVLGRDSGVLASVAALARPGGALRVLVSATERDGRAPLTLADLTALRPAYAEAGLALIAARPATADHVAAAHSTWGKRLGVGRARPAFILHAARR